MESLDRIRVSPLHILQHRPYLRICAPMVRYSKQPFRELVLNYGVDVVYAPMMLAQPFKNSQIARDMELTTSERDTPLVVQFASHNAHDLAAAALLVAPFCNGIDINCGYVFEWDSYVRCPQSWACKEGLGAHLMSKPELVADMISSVKRITSAVKFESSTGTGVPCSVKIRVHKNLQETVEFARRAGADWITVHGRTKSQKSTEPVDLSAIALIKSSVSVPVFANGDIFTLQHAEHAHNETACDGVMSARGLLENPALFTGVPKTPLECVEKFMRMSVGYGSNCFITHHHLGYMLDSSMSKSEKRAFNCLTSIAGILDFLEDHYAMDFSDMPLPDAPPSKIKGVLF